MKGLRLTSHLAGAGLFAGAVAWALHQQASYVFGSLYCEHSSPAPMWLLSAAAILIVAAAASLSWRSLRLFAREKRGATNDAFRARRFLATVSIMGAGLFLFAILLQLAASFYLPLCVG